VKGKLAIIAFALFVLVDASLIFALHHHLKKQDDAAAAGPASLKPTASDATTTAAKPTGPRSLVLSPTGLLARVTRGECVKGGRPALELSGDGGKTFNEIPLPLLESSSGETSRETVRTILQVRIDSAAAITIVGSDDKCVGRRFDSTNGGQSWSPSSTIKTWYVDATDTSVISPTGASNPGCDVVALAPSSDSAAKALCSTGEVRSTSDNGASWTPVGTVDGLTAGTFVGPLNGIAAAPSGSCKSSAFTTTDGGAQWANSGCISTKGGVTSIVGNATHLFALVGDKVLISANNGKTWLDRAS
jgi:hypothetical protein